MLSAPKIHVLGLDPPNRKALLNGNAFQQEALTSFKGWQYVAFYSPLSHDQPEPQYVYFGRRKVNSSDWELFVFNDYEQHEDDSHNTIQIGLCHGDGTIHISYDHHCDRLRYRHSVPNLANTPSEFEWKASQFTTTQSTLPGLPEEFKLLDELTYPRFIPINDDLLFSHRTGRAGLGSDLLYVYKSDTRKYQYMGKHLTGVQNNPYVNGIDYRNGVLHITWTYRGFIWYEGWDDPLDTKHKVPAGPNGPENNYDINYIYSEDLGYTWKNGAGKVLASLKDNETILPSAEGIVSFAIPKNSGMINQLSQAVDYAGGVHTINKDDVEGVLKWWHYYRDPEGEWTRTAIQGLGRAEDYNRGRVVASVNNDIYLIMPDKTHATWKILKASKSSNYRQYQTVWEGAGYPAEPLVDLELLEKCNILSIFGTLRRNAEEATKVIVLDFDLGVEKNQKTEFE